MTAGSYPCLFLMIFRVQPQGETKQSGPPRGSGAYPYAPAPRAAAALTEIVKFCLQMSRGIELFPKKNKTCSDNEIAKRFHRLFEGFSKKDRLKNRDLANFLDGILIEASRAIENEEFDKAILSKSIRYINEFYTTSINIPLLAKMENMCVSLFNATFKKALGITPTKYIIKLRMQYAIELLENSDIPINEIATMCGYKDTNFFIRTFKEILKVPPLVYRKNLKHR